MPNDITSLITSLSKYDGNTIKESIIKITENIAIKDNSSLEISSEKFLMNWPMPYAAVIGKVDIKVLAPRDSFELDARKFTLNVGPLGQTHTATQNTSIKIKHGDGTEQTHSVPRGAKVTFSDGKMMITHPL